jgi:hypothetical protein
MRNSQSGKAAREETVRRRHRTGARDRRFSSSATTPLPLPRPPFRVGDLMVHAPVSERQVHVHRTAFGWQRLAAKSRASNFAVRRPLSLVRVLAVRKRRAGSLRRTRTHERDHRYFTGTSHPCYPLPLPQPFPPDSLSSATSTEPYTPLTFVRCCSRSHCRPGPVERPVSAQLETPGRVAADGRVRGVRVEGESDADDQRARRVQGLEARDVFLALTLFFMDGASRAGTAGVSSSLAESLRVTARRVLLVQQRLPD